VVLVDPREARRAIMHYFIDQCPVLTVVGLAADLDEAVTQIRAEQADVALVEIQMPLAEGLATIEALRAAFPDLRIVVCSFHDDAETRSAAQERGADGYLAKPPSAFDLLRLVAGPSSAAPAAGIDFAAES
jgi:DNA-binding NarL/FixJ family response regulator